MDTKTLVENLTPNSVELAMNAKGKVQATVKTYHADPKTAADLAIEVLNHVKQKLGDQLATA